MNDTSYYETFENNKYNEESLYMSCYKPFFNEEHEYSQKCSYCESDMFTKGIQICDEIDKSSSDFNQSAIYANNKNGDDTQSLNKAFKQKVQIIEGDDMENIDIRDDKLYKNYRKAHCMNCNKDFMMNYKYKYYCFWGVFCYKIIDDYKQKF
jgi:hypothetical protein